MDEQGVEYRVTWSVTDAAGVSGLSVNNRKFRSEAAARSYLDGVCERAELDRTWDGRFDAQLWRFVDGQGVCVWSLLKAPWDAQADMVSPRWSQRDEDDRTYADVVADGLERWAR